MNVTLYIFLGLIVWRYIMEKRYGVVILESYVFKDTLILYYYYYMEFKNQYDFTKPKTKIFTEIETKMKALKCNYNLLPEQINILNESPIIIHFDHSHLDNIIESNQYTNCHEYYLRTGEAEPRSGIRTTNREYRMKRENELFFDLYRDNKDNIIKYGALNVGSCEWGFKSLWGYGKTYFTLKSHMKNYCTFTWYDSINVKDKNDVFLLTNPFYDVYRQNAIFRKMQKENDDYIEVQIHSSINIKEDIESLHAPLSFKDNKEISNHFDVLKEYGIQIVYYDDN